MIIARKIFPIFFGGGLARAPCLPVSYAYAAPPQKLFEFLQMAEVGWARGTESPFPGFDIPRVRVRDRLGPTVGVVGVRTPPKIQFGGVRHPKKVKGEHRTFYPVKGCIGISNFQAAVKCSKRCVKSHKIAHKTSLPKSFAAGALRQTPLGELTTLSQTQ